MKGNHVKTLAGSVLALSMTAWPASAEPADSPAMDGPISGFQLVVGQSAGEVSSINFAFGRGADVQFFSNIEDLATWQDGDGGIRMGVLNEGAGESSVILGVCSGDQCEVARGVSFTSDVGTDLAPR